MIKLVDQLSAMGSFPIATAQDIICSDNERLQEKIDNGTLGCGDSSVTLTQEEFELLSDEEKFNGLYYTYDTKRIYKNGIQYGANEPLELTMAEFKTLKEAGALDEQQEYIITTNENGVLLEASDIGYNGTTSGLSSLSVQGAIDEVNDKIDNIIDDENVNENTVLSGKKTTEELVKKQENIFKKHILNVRSGEANRYVLLASCKISNLTLHNEPIILRGVMGDNTNTNKPLFEVSVSFKTYTTADTIFTGYINKNIFNITDMFITVDESTKTAYLYLDMGRTWTLASFDIEIPQRNTEYYGLTIADVDPNTQSDTFIGDEIVRMSTSTGVKVLAGLDDTTSSTESTWSSSKIASEINPTIDISKVFSDGTLNITTLCSTYGNGRYVIVGQGTAGNGSATIDIWTLVGNAISYMVNVTYSNRTSNIFVGYTYDNPTINFETGYLNSCNHIAKVCTLA